MTQNRDQLYLQHILECIEKIESYTRNGKAQFDHDPLIQDAVTRNLQILAESSQRISDNTKLIAPDLPWRELSGSRNVLVHDYPGIDMTVVWSVVEQEPPKLKTGIKGLLS